MSRYQLKVASFNGNLMKEHYTKMHNVFLSRKQNNLVWNVVAVTQCSFSDPGIYLNNGRHV